MLVDDDDDDDAYQQNKSERERERKIITFQPINGNVSLILPRCDIEELNMVPRVLHECH